MSKKLTKLSRGRPKPKVDSSNKQLNNSDEDFQSVISKPSNHEKSSQKSEKNSQKSQNITTTNETFDQNVTSVAGGTTLQPCPFCSKKFSIGQELSRASHLKSCASQLGKAVYNLNFQAHSKGEVRGSGALHLALPPKMMEQYVM